MTPLPKKKHAKSRTKTRKSTWKLSLPKLVTCSNCQSLRLPHRACPNCGFYDKVKAGKGKIGDTENKQGKSNEDQKRPQTPK